MQTAGCPLGETLEVLFLLKSQPLNTGMNFSYTVLLSWRSKTLKIPSLSNGTNFMAKTLTYHIPIPYRPWNNLQLQIVSFRFPVMPDEFDTFQDALGDFENWLD